MKGTIVWKFFITTIAILFSSYFLPGIAVKGFWVAVIVALVIALLNLLLRPIIKLLTLPATVFTLGLFMFIINSFMIYLAGKIVSGFVVTGFGWAILASIIVTSYRMLFTSESKSD